MSWTSPHYDGKDTDSCIIPTNSSMLVVLQFCKIYDIIVFPADVTLHINLPVATAVRLK